MCFYHAIFKNNLHLSFMFYVKHLGKFNIFFLNST